MKKRRRRCLCSGVFFVRTSIINFKYLKKFKSLLYKSEKVCYNYSVKL